MSIVLSWLCVMSIVLSWQYVMSIVLSWHCVISMSSLMTLHHVYSSLMTVCHIYQLSHDTVSCRFVISWHCVMSVHSLVTLCHVCEFSHDTVSFRWVLSWHCVMSISSPSLMTVCHVYDVLECMCDNCRIGRLLLLSYKSEQLTICLDSRNKFVKNSSNERNAPQISDAWAAVVLTFLGLRHR